MAHPINEAKQRRIDALMVKTNLENQTAAKKIALADVLRGAVTASEGDTDTLRKECRDLDGKLTAARSELLAAEQALDAIQDRYAVEDAQLGGSLAPGGRRSEGGPEGGIGLKYSQLFGSVATVTAGGFESRSEYFRCVSAGLHHPGLIQAAAVMKENVGSDGGFLVPDELVAEAFDGAVEDEPILSMVRIEPMASETKRIAGFATKNHQTGGPFGFSGGWIPEGGTMSPEKGLVRSIKLVAKKLGLLVQASNEIAADGLGFDAQLEGAMRKALGWLLADAVFNGSGAGQPAGIVGAASTVVADAEAGQGNGTLVYDNVIGMLSRLLPSSMGRAAWFASHTLRPALMKLSVAVGTGGQLIPLTLQGGRYYLLGIPLYWTEHLPALGTKGDLLLVDASQYALGLRKQVTLDRSAHVGFTSDLLTFRGIVRADGESLHDSTFQPKNGTTMGPAVVLESDRS